MTPDETRHPGAPERTSPARSRKTETVAAEDARQGEIILHAPQAHHLHFRTCRIRRAGPGDEDPGVTGSVARQ